MSDEVKDLFKSTVLKFVISKIVAQLPFLGIPGIGCAFSLLVNWLGGKIFDHLQEVIEFKIIDNKVKEQVDNYSAALENLKTEIHKPDAEKNNAAISLAKEEYKKRLRELISANSIK